MAKGDTVQEVLVNNNQKKTLKEKLNSDNVFGSVEKDAKAGIVFGTAVLLTISGIAGYNSVKREKAISELTYTLIAKAPQVSSFSAEYIAYYPDMTCVGGIAVANQKEVEGYFTIDQGIAIDKVDQNTYGTIKSISYDAIDKVTEAAKSYSVTFTEGKLADKVANDEMVK
ncbi:MAG: hypothetical protein J6X00_00640 [Clostridia bacterium]|nr:hypothetical protein [Clostridia bacterium]